MSHYTLVLNGIVLILLILLSGFFSCAETGLMAINRYRLRHQARLKKKYAILILKLLKRPDRLLGTILIGNNVFNIVASALSTLIAIQLFGEKGIIPFTVVLTIAILIFAEVAPKTLAALYPEVIAKMVAGPIFLLQIIFYPVIVLINILANGLLRLFKIKVSGHTSEPLTRDELRSVVFEATGKVPHQYQSMLLGILDLNKMTVEDAMIPRHGIQGIDLDQPFAQIQEEIAQNKYDWLPVYRENINNIEGVLHIRELLLITLSNTLNRDHVIKAVQPAYFVPQGTLLNTQLLNFQQQRKRMALVVDEYGEITGLITLKDILEEIVGEFTMNVAVENKMIHEQKDKSFLVDGSITVRELNRFTEWDFPTKGPRTLNGLIIEQLEAIPRAGICVLINNYPIEIIEIKENRVHLAKVFPALR